MASLQKHRVKGRTYWRIVESRRVGGKPRPIPVMYLGTADQLLARLLGAPSGRLRVRSFQHGDVAALKAMADRLELTSIIDAHVPPSRRRLSVGTTLLLAAINRAVSPCSKRSWAGWAARTSIHHLFGIRTKPLTSQYFWDQMNHVSEEALVAIEDDITQKVVGSFDLKLDTLFYDATNFFTYIASTNGKSTLTRRGKNKQGRGDLRQFSLALLVSRDGQVPLCSQVYEGNMVDSKSFPVALTQIRRRLERLVGELEDITLVYDKGNNSSKKNQGLVDAAPFHYVASLCPSHHRELMGIPTGEYMPVAEGRLRGVPVFRCQREIWDRRRTVVLYISDKLREGQIRGLHQHLGKRMRALKEWKATLARPRTGPRSRHSAQKKIKGLLSGQHVSQVLRVRYDGRRKGANRLSWFIDEAAFERLKTEVFGKRILITDHDEWGSEQIILAYRGQSHVEKVFEHLKNPKHLAVRPQFHWTDHKVKVHTFICLLGYLLSQLVNRLAAKGGWAGDLAGLLDLLAGVRLAMVLRSTGDKGGRPRSNWILEDKEEQAWRWFQRLVPPRPPFVYTREMA